MGRMQEQESRGIMGFMGAYQLAAADWRRLRQHPALPRASGVQQEQQLCYYDTPDAALAGRGLLLVQVRTGWEQRLELLALAAEHSNGQAPQRLAAGHGEHGRLNFDFVPEKALRKWLMARAHQLEPVASERVRQEVLSVDTAAGPVQLVLEQVQQQPLPHLRGPEAAKSGASESAAGQARGGASKVFSFGRVLLQPSIGQEEGAYLLARSLLQAFALQPLAAQPLAQGMAPTLTGAVRARPSLPQAARRPHKNEPGQAAGLAFLHIARNCLTHLQQNLPGLVHSEQEEYVHQARVAIRRLRSAIKLFAPWLPPEFVAEYAARWRDQANALGDCRNLDVFLAETLPLLQRELGSGLRGQESGPDTLLQRLEKLARRQRDMARRQARAAVSSPEARLLQLDFLWALQGLVFPAAMPPLRELARRRLVSRARQVTRLGQAVRDLDPEARHELRIAFKKLRYALEFFTPLFGPRRSRAYLAGLVDLQEVLGHLNDLATATTLVQQLLPPAQARLPLAWLTGRVGALVETLPSAVGHFLDAQPPWKAPARR